MEELTPQLEIDVPEILAAQIEDVDPLPATEVTLEPASSAVLPEMELAEVSPLAKEQTGTLEAYILNNETYKKAQRLRADPRFEQLEQRTRTDFLNEWQALASSRTGISRDILLDECRPLDKEKKDLTSEVKRLTEEGSSIGSAETVLRKDTREYNERVNELGRDLSVYKKARDQYMKDAEAFKAENAPHKANVAQFNAELGTFNSQCTGRPLQSGELSRCLAWQGRLEQRRSELGRKTAELRPRAQAIARKSRELEQQRAALQTRSDAVKKREAEIKKAWDDLRQRKKKYQDDSKKATERAASLAQKWQLETKRIGEWETALRQFNERLEKAQDGISKLQEWEFISWDLSRKPHEASVRVQPTGPFRSDQLREWQVDVPGCNPPHYSLPIQGTFVVGGREVRFACEGHGCGNGDNARSKTVCEGFGKLDDAEFPRGRRASGTMKVTVTDPLQIRLITNADSISALYKAVEGSLSKTEFDQLVAGRTVEAAKAAVSRRLGPRSFQQDWQGRRIG